jgi:hypothetical protein
VKERRLFLIRGAGVALDDLLGDRDPGQFAAARQELTGEGGEIAVRAAPAGRVRGSALEDRFQKLAEEGDLHRLTQWFE